MRTFNDKNSYTQNVDFDQLSRKVSNTKRRFRHVRKEDSVSIPDLISNCVNVMESDQKNEVQWIEIHDSIQHLLTLVQQLRNDGYDLQYITDKIQLKEIEKDLLKMLVMNPKKVAVSSEETEKSGNRFEFAFSE